ncbi:MAG: cyclopropane-fatty-acyl-phospholipid synthase family protein [Planctomycetota bacterium]
MTLIDPERALASPLRRSAAPGAAPSRRLRPSLLERAVRARLDLIRDGSLTVVTRDDIAVYGEAPEAEGTRAGAVHGLAEIHDPRFWQAIALRGNVGAGEAYAYGWWSSPEPTDVVRVFVANQNAMDRLDGGLARLSLPLLKLYHALRDNTRKGSRKNISAHYDLSNDFFELFLDPTMTYSSAVFEREGMSLEDAQLAKIDRLCERLDLGPDDHLLEIGTGWGAFAERAASRFGCRVTTTTISKEQHAYARSRIERAGLSDRVEVLLRDYRDLEGSFSKVVSVEMIEAVGAKHYETFFANCQRLLRPGGALAMQAITIHDRHFEAARNRVDFIQRHIFPGSCIPSVTALTGAASRATDMRMVQLEDVGEHYAPTLRLWRERLRARRNEAEALGFDLDFLRLFDFYFAYCEGGFEERHISVSQLVFAREGRAFAPRIAETLVQRS